MTLKEYQRKRNFQKSHEPEGKEDVSHESRLFVIQKHAASRLHYDLRLELDGVLKSWALPKGPSLDPGQKRLAVHVEDHPLEYGTFEGTIPKEEYGGGTVMLWDKGTWIPDGDPMEDYRKGRMHFEIQGEKLRGKWILFKMAGDKSSNKQNWLFVKSKDAHADKDIADRLLDEQDRSVSTGRSMEQIALHRDTGADQPEDSLPPPPFRLKSAQKASMPEVIHPQLPTLVETPPLDNQWLHEIKYDGYRIIAFLKNGSARLMSRNGKDWTSRLQPVAYALAGFPAQTAVIDGEVVMQRPDGTTSFQALQNSFQGPTSGTLLYYVFDLLYRDGYDLTRSPLLERKNHLAQCLGKMDPRSEVIRFSDHIQGSGGLVYEHACRIALEGIISKDGLSTYHQKRTRGWVKIKCQHRDEFVIGGYTEPSGSRTGFGALLLGIYDDKLLGSYDDKEELRYCGKVGTGFSRKQLASLKKNMVGLERKTPPFINPPKGADARGVHWINPELVAEVAFTGWTQDDILRHPAFKGLREDKPAKDVRRKTMISTKTPVKIPAHIPAKLSMDTAEAEQPKPTSRKETPEVNEAGKAGPAIKHVRLTNEQRIYYPELGTTKADLVRYYQLVSDYMLPHVVHRPLSLLRCPRGRGQDCFYQKHFTESLPVFVREIEIEDKNGAEKYIVVDDIEGLISLVQLGVLEFHPWNAREDRIDRPDLIVMDLDPAPGVALADVVKGTRLLHEFLTTLGLRSFLKTSGGKGFHVVVPLQRRSGWDVVKGFARAVAVQMTRIHPDRFVATVSKKKRAGKIYIDYLRNGRGATSVAPYSTRANHGAPISMPMTWEELSPRTAPDKYRINNIEERLRAFKEYPWKDFFNTTQSITKSIQKQIDSP